MLLTPTLRKLDDAVRPVCPLMEGLEQRRMLAVDIQFSGPTDVNEGSGAGYGLAFSGLPQGATFIGWRIDWGDGSSPSGSSDPSPFLGHTYPDGESYATLCATLDYQDQSSYDHTYTESLYIHINNIAPTLDVSADDSCEEGSAVNVYVSATDPGDDSVYQWHIDWGDGASSQIYANAGGTVHVYPDGDNSYSINVVAYDDDGTYTAGPFGAFCSNVAPSLSISASSSYVSEGSEVSLSASAWDPGDDTIQGWIIDWGDGSSAETYYGGPSSAFSHTYADADGSNNTFGISAQAWDEDGTYSGGSADVIVSNVAPSLTLDTNDNGDLYVVDTVTLYMDDSDPGDDTIYQWVIDWGDGGSAQTITGDPDSVTHEYSIAGEHSITATAYDEDDSYSAGTSVSLAEVTLDALAAADGSDPDNVATDADGGGATLTFATDASGYGSVQLSGLATPNVSRAYNRIFYKVVNGSGATVASGALGGGASPSLAEGNYTALAGVDANQNGVLDGGEASRSILLQAARFKVVPVNGLARVVISIAAGVTGTLDLHVWDFNRGQSAASNLSVKPPIRQVVGANRMIIASTALTDPAKNIWTLTVNRDTAIAGDEFTIRVEDSSRVSAPCIIRVVITP